MNSGAFRGPESATFLLLRRLWSPPHRGGFSDCRRQHTPLGSAGACSARYCSCSSTLLCWRGPCLRMQQGKSRVRSSCVVLTFLQHEHLGASREDRREHPRAALRWHGFDDAGCSTYIKKRRSCSGDDNANAAAGLMRSACWVHAGVGNEGGGVRGLEHSGR